MKKYNWKEVNTRALEEGGIEGVLFEDAREFFEKGDIEGVLMTMPNEYHLCFVADNLHVLKKIGKYEKALLNAYEGTRTNYSNWSFEALKFLFHMADIHNLRKAGNKIPDKKIFTLYRGVIGTGRARRVNSFSWTESPNTAAWFAQRFVSFLCDPAVYKITVPNENILACLNNRNEKEYLLSLPLQGKPKRLKEMPDAFLPRDKRLLKSLQGIKI